MSNVIYTRCAVVILRIDLVLQPVLRNLLLNHLHIPRVLRAEIPAASGDPESALGARRAERAVRPADRAAFAEGNLIVLFLRRRLRLLLGCRLLLLLRLYLRVLALNLNRVRLLLFDLGLRLA